MELERSNKPGTVTVNTALCHTCQKSKKTLYSCKTNPSFKIDTGFCTRRYVAVSALKHL